MTIQEPPIAGLGRLVELFQALNRAGVRYCHWKSNLRLAESLDGRTDLDLLVDRADGAPFGQILLAHDVKPTLAAPGKDYPGVEHHLGYDPSTGRIFHLHVHYSLILGEQFVKNYRLPLERAFLDSASTRRGVKTPAPELEIIILALRALLKYRDRDAVQAVLRSDVRGGLPASIVEEFRFLMAQTDSARIAQTLAEQAPFLPGEVVMATIEAIGRPQVDARQLFSLRRQVLAALSTYQRFSRRRARLLYYRAATRQSRPFKMARRLQRSPKQRQTPVSGGLTVAITGADGAGKSTVVGEIVRWLSWRLSVSVYYLGSSQPGRTAAALKTAARLLDKAHAGARRVMGQERFPARLLWRGRMFVKNLSYVAVGRDRYRRFVAGQQRANNGAVVIFDRFPLPGLSVNGRPADGPRIAYANPAPLGRFTRKLAQIEESYYRRIPGPENLVLLQVSPEVSLARKPDHSREEIEAKCLAMRGLDAGASNLIEINADRPLEMVLGQVKANLWRLL
jgi:thymidylate kinase